MTTFFEKYHRIITINLITTISCGVKVYERILWHKYWILDKGRA